MNIITYEQGTKLLQKRFGKGNFKRKWNHGGHSLFVKNNQGRFVMYAYDYEHFIKELASEN